MSRSTFVLQRPVRVFVAMFDVVIEGIELSLAGTVTSFVAPIIVPLVKVVDTETE